MKQLIRMILGDSVDLLKALKGEAGRLMVGLKRTGRYVMYWALFSAVMLSIGLSLCWNGAAETTFKTLVGYSWGLSTLVLALISWNVSFVGFLIAWASTGADELLGEKTPNVEPATVAAFLRRMAGWIVWVQFAHLVAMIAPIEVWRDAWSTIAALIALTIVVGMMFSGWTSGRFGRIVVWSGAVGFLLFFFGRHVPGVNDYVGTHKDSMVRSLTLSAAEDRLADLPADLLVGKLNKLIELQKSAAQECGDLACNDADRETTAKLQREIALLRKGKAVMPSAPKPRPTAVPSYTPTYGTYGEHALPPPPTVAELASH